MEAHRHEARVLAEALGSRDDEEAAVLHEARARTGHWAARVPLWPRPSRRLAERQRLATANACTCTCGALVERPRRRCRRRGRRRLRLALELVQQAPRAREQLRLALRVSRPQAP